MKSVRLVQIFRPVKETNRTHSKGYVEDLVDEERAEKMCQDGRLNLSVLPLYNGNKGRLFFNKK